MYLYYINVVCFSKLGSALVVKPFPLPSIWGVRVMAIKIKFGTNNDDTIDYSSGPYVNYYLIVYGGNGNDLIKGGNKSDILFGGQGNDTIFGGFDNDILWGDSGNDILVGDIQGASSSPGETVNYGSNILYGGGGNDLLIGGVGGNGYAVPVLESGTFTLYYGHNLLVAGSGKEILIGSFGNMSIIEDNVAYTRVDGGNTLIGGKGDAILAGNRAYIQAYTTHDVSPTITHNASLLIGGSGNNIMVGDEKFNEVKHFGAQPDGTVTGVNFAEVEIGIGSVLIGGDKTNFMAGGRANAINTFTSATLSKYIEEGDDTLVGGKGNDTIIGDREGQSIFLSGVNDFTQLYQPRGDDVITGGGGNDILIGDDSTMGTDYVRTPNLFGSQGLFTNTDPSVKFYGGNTLNGNDTLQGGKTGDDIMWGDNDVYASPTSPTFLPTVANLAPGTHTVSLSLDGSNIPIVTIDGHTIIHTPQTPQTIATGTFTNVVASGEWTDGVSVFGISGATVPGSDTFVFDVAKGWGRDTVMDFNGLVSAGSSSSNINLLEYYNSQGVFAPQVVTVSQTDNLQFKNVHHIAGNTFAYQDVDAQILSITATTASTPAVGSNTGSLGAYFTNDTITNPNLNLSYEAPSATGPVTHTLGTMGAYESANLFTIPVGVVDVAFKNGSHIIFADVKFDATHAYTGIEDLFTTSAATSTSHDVNLLAAQAHVVIV
jgi:Ca2+-binding RTX toxin-like protein